jgi:hypothetical protein
VRRLLVLLAFVPVAAGCGHSAPRVPPSAIALVGDRAVSRAEFNAELGRGRPACAVPGERVPKNRTEAYQELKDSVVRLLVDRAQLEIEAKRSRIVIGPAEIEARFRRFKQSAFGGNEARYRDQLRATGMTDADVRAAIRAELLAAALRKTASGGHPQLAKVVYAPGFAPRDQG